jgi:hypothetical protein
MCCICAAFFYYFYNFYFYNFFLFDIQPQSKIHMNASAVAALVTTAPISPVGSNHALLEEMCAVVVKPPCTTLNCRCSRKPYGVETSSSSCCGKLKKFPKSKLSRLDWLSLNARSTLIANIFLRMLRDINRQDYNCNDGQN